MGHGLPWRPIFKQETLPWWREHGYKRLQGLGEMVIPSPSTVVAAHRERALMHTDAY
jgi:hypothetical protein